MQHEIGYKIHKFVNTEKIQLFNGANCKIDSKLIYKKINHSLSEFTTIMIRGKNGPLCSCVDIVRIFSLKFSINSLIFT